MPSVPFLDAANYSEHFLRILKGVRGILKKIRSGYLNSNKGGQLCIQGSWLCEKITCYRLCVPQNVEAKLAPAKSYLPERTPRL